MSIQAHPERIYNLVNSWILLALNKFSCLTVLQFCKLEQTNMSVSLPQSHSLTEDLKVCVFIFFLQYVTMKLWSAWSFTEIERWRLAASAAYCGLFGHARLWYETFDSCAEEAYQRAEQQRLNLIFKIHVWDVINNLYDCLYKPWTNWILIGPNPPSPSETPYEYLKMLVLYLSFLL